MPEECVSADVEQGLVRVARVLVDPAVGRGAPAGHAERQPDVAGHGVRVEQEDLHVLSELEHGREIRRDRGLADAALRVEHREDRGGGRPLGVDVARRRGPRRSSAHVGTWARIAIASMRQRSASTLHGRSTISSFSSMPAASRPSSSSSPARNRTDRWPGRPRRASATLAAMPPGRRRRRRRRRSSGSSAERLGDRAAGRELDRLEAGLGQGVVDGRSLGVGQQDGDGGAGALAASVVCHHAAGSWAVTLRLSPVASVISDGEGGQVPRSPRRGRSPGRG